MGIDNEHPVALILGGKTSLVGHALQEVLEQAGWQVHVTGREDIDFFKASAEKKLGFFLKTLKPTHVFNCIAYTQVDKAEDEPEKANTLNLHVPQMLIKVLKKHPAQLVHYSTDFVFDGKQDIPYATDSPVAPLCVYGKTKLAGEKALLNANMQECLIIRTAWLFGPGKGNFIQTILTKAQELDALNVVHDQIGSPTYTIDLALHTLQLIEAKTQGVFHIVNSGQASWCELAQEAAGLVFSKTPIHAVPSSFYPQKALRPAYSVLNTQRFTCVTGTTPRPWPQALRDYIFRSFSPRP